VFSEFLGGPGRQVIVFGSVVAPCLVVNVFDLCCFCWVFMCVCVLSIFALSLMASFCNVTVFVVGEASRINESVNCVCFLTMLRVRGRLGVF